MRLDFKSLAFGYSVKNSVSTPAWETALGQGSGYKINNSDSINELVKGLIYKAVPPDTISFKRRGGAIINGANENSGLVIASVFDNVYINDIKINDGKFVLFVLKDDSESHKGRLKLKYGRDNTYTIEGESISNNDFISRVLNQLELASDACWFVTDISVVEQDKLVLKTTVINKTGKVEYDDSKALHAAWDKYYNEDSEENPLNEDRKRQKVCAEIETEVIPDNLSLDELGEALREMRERFGDDGIRYFGLKYGKILAPKPYTYAEIYRASNLPNPSYSVEIGKGVNIYNSILHNEYGIRFVGASVSSSCSRLDFVSGLKCELPRNRIVFGAPGTGKSYTINKERKELLEKLLGKDKEENYERVTFHPDYSYANFVGTYKPVMVKKTNPITNDKNVDFVLSVLNSKDKSAQDKYDLLFEQFKSDEGLTRLPILLGLSTDETFKTKKKDGSDTADDNSVERNTGKAIRKYVNLINNDDGSGDIAYEYVPGPFMRVYVKALKNARSGNPEPYILVIEEINRANVAAVFGDIFQLLDRGEDNISEYPIQASEDIKRYLAKELGGDPDNYSQICIPDNMFIWATMNSADQGVFPMDTAFKRRWDFKYLGIDESDKDIRGKFVVVGSKEQQRIEWNELRKAINEFLANEKINEDKQLGPYFLSRSIVVPDDGGDEIDSEKFSEAFKNKVLMYLFDDAAKQKRGKLFEGSAKGQNRYSKICEAFDEQGIGIFAADIQNRIKVQDVKTNGSVLDGNGMVKADE